MPRVHRCANGHQWESPVGAAPADDTSTLTCPVCGAAEPRTVTFAGNPGLPTVPGYELIDEVGRGGMGVVYKARHAESGRTVALKIIRKERLGNPEAVRRFRRESQAAARLSHPNVVLVYESDQAGDQHYLAMEFVEGVTLQRLAEQHGPLPVAQACEWIRQAALGLQHAHEQSLVHRDIKPSNLMLARSPLRPRPASGDGAGPTSQEWQGAVVKVLDMGVARLYQSGASMEESLTTLTQDGAVVGTPDYIAPEQLEDAHQADIRADLYSLGCTFYYLLTSQVPFPGGTLIQKMDKQRWETPPSVDQLRPEIPASVAGVVRKLMAKRPADRYQTPAELATGLEQLSRAGHVTAPPRPAPLRELRRLIGHEDSVWSVAFAPDGQSLLSTGKDRTLRLWDVASGRLVRTLATLPHEVRCVVFSPDGRLAVAAVGITVRVLDVTTGQEVGRYSGHTNTVKALAVSPNGRRALSGGDDRTLCLWELNEGHERRRMAMHKGIVNGVAFTPDGRHALSGSRDQTIRLWDVEQGRELPRFPPQKSMVLSVAVSPDGRFGLSGNFDTRVRLWDLATGRELRRFQGHKQMVPAVVFTPDSRRVLSGSHDQTVRLWDVESGHDLSCFGGHTAAVTCLAVTSEGKLAVSGSMDRTVRVWQLPD
jgi:serine/threonine protein kinase